MSTIPGIIHTMIQIVQYQDLEDTNLCFRYETTGPMKMMDAIDVLPKWDFIMEDILIATEPIDIIGIMDVDTGKISKLFSEILMFMDGLIIKIQISSTTTLDMDTKTIDIDTEFNYIAMKKYKLNIEISV